MVTSNNSNNKCHIFSLTFVSVQVEQMSCLKTNILISYLFQTKHNWLFKAGNWKKRNCPGNPQMFAHWPLVCTSLWTTLPKASICPSHVQHPRKNSFLFCFWTAKIFQKKLKSECTNEPNVLSSNSEPSFNADCPTLKALLEGSELREGKMWCSIFTLAKIIIKMKVFPILKPVLKEKYSLIMETVLCKLYLMYFWKTRHGEAVIPSSPAINHLIPLNSLKHTLNLFISSAQKRQQEQFIWLS